MSHQSAYILSFCFYMTQNTNIRYPSDNLDANVDLQIDRSYTAPIAALSKYRFPINARNNIFNSYLFFLFGAYSLQVEMNIFLPFLSAWLSSPGQYHLPNRKELRLCRDLPQELFPPNVQRYYQLHGSNPTLVVSVYSILFSPNYLCRYLSLPFLLVVRQSLITG